jgi:hypothetical protein
VAVWRAARYHLENLRACCKSMRTGRVDEACLRAKEPPFDGGVVVFNPIHIDP